ncbi:hypothetical protein CONCODRAFT_165414, partial [Conidiobolus coronatus NRRL 28638]
LDCDWAAFSIYTFDWLKLIGPLSLIQLSSHKPACRDNIGEFANWIYIGTGTGYIRVPPYYKQSIINAIKQYGIQVSQSNNNFTLIKGNQHIIGYELGQIFQDLGIDSLRIVMYGMKSQYNWKLIDDIIKNHPKAAFNYWDIGRNYHHNNIILAKSNPSKTYPMLNIIGQRYGWVSKTIHKMNYKIYPRLTHILKSEKQMQSWNLPKIGATLSKKYGQFNSLYDTLIFKSQDPIEWGYGGLRIEVRINAPTLTQAKDSAITWDYFSWDNLNTISFYKVSKLDYLNNISSILNSAANEDLWTIDNNQNIISKEKTLILIDIFNAFGWCPTDNTYISKISFENQWWGLGNERVIYNLDQPNIFTKEELCERFELAKANGVLTFCWRNYCVSDCFIKFSRPNKFRVKCTGNKEDPHYCEHENIDRWINDNYNEHPVIQENNNNEDQYKIAIELVKWESGTKSKTGEVYYTWRNKVTKNKGTMKPTIEEAAKILVKNPNWRSIPIYKKQFNNLN